MRKFCVDTGYKKLSYFYISPLSWIFAKLASYRRVGFRLAKYFYQKIRWCFDKHEKNSLHNLGCIYTEILFLNLNTKMK